jgi:acyl-[acyl carrier protein]--UDP-N-acetylglucosamine O-acyltransferase
MATKKRTKKTEEKLVLEMPGTIGSAKLVFPKVTVGSHLTVTEYEDGSTKLEWDDEALLRDVREAIASVK